MTLHPLHVYVEAAALDVRQAATKHHSILPRSTEYYHPDGRPMLAPYSLVTGHLIDLHAPDFSHLSVAELITAAAGGLARICRYGGQVLHFYSVAQHCILGLELIARHVEALEDPERIGRLQAEMRRLDPDQREHPMLALKHGREGFLAAKRLVSLHYLLHDVSEGLGLGDIPFPLKRLIEPIYGPLEERMMAAFYRRIDLAPPTPEVAKLVKEIDVRMLHEEQGLLRGRSVPDGFKHFNWGDVSPFHNGEDTDHIAATAHRWAKELRWQLNNPIGKELL